MLQTVVDAAAVFAVVGTVAYVSPDKSSTINAIAVDSSQAARFRCFSMMRFRIATTRSGTSA